MVEWRVALSIEQLAEKNGRSEVKYMDLLCKKKVFYGTFTYKKKFLDNFYVLSLSRKQCVEESGGICLRWCKKKAASYKPYSVTLLVFISPVNHFIFLRSPLHICGGAETKCWEERELEKDEPSYLKLISRYLHNFVFSVLSI